jgi:tRNA-specific 2-thiouridylase
LDLAQRIIVGMSGGVDSSVAAILLKQQGYEVVGVFMKNWDEKDEDGLCTATQDYEDVRSVCDQIDIPYYSVNFAKEYWDRVFVYFLEEYKQMRTPNPDVLCNREIKFKAFLDFALKNDAVYMATGHYARKQNSCDGTLLLCGADQDKDQSYFLYMLDQHMLGNALFPIGDMKKTQVRALAQQYRLKTAAKKDSTGVCFIGERNFKKFLQGFLPAIPGDITDEGGHVLGKHDGLMFYTIGQRKGMGIGGRGDGGAFFVIDKDIVNNRLIVAQGEDHPRLYAKALWAQDAYWTLGGAPVQEGIAFSCQAKTRYRQPMQNCELRLSGSGIEVAFEAPQRAVTPGQAVVFYQGEVCLGGATIAHGL